LSLGHIHIGTEFGEIENSIEQERIIRIEMYPEEGIFLERIEITIKL
jgi:hypothetical protein